MKYLYMLSGLNVIQKEESQINIQNQNRTKGSWVCATAHNSDWLSLSMWKEVVLEKGVEEDMENIWSE